MRCVLLVVHAHSVGRKRGIQKAKGKYRNILQKLLEGALCTALIGLVTLLLVRENFRPHLKERDRVCGQIDDFDWTLVPSGCQQTSSGTEAESSNGETEASGDAL